MSSAVENGYDSDNDEPTKINDLMKQLRQRKTINANRHQQGTNAKILEDKISSLAQLLRKSRDKR